VCGPTAQDSLGGVAERSSEQRRRGEWHRRAAAQHHNGDLADGPLLDCAFRPHGSEKGEDPAGPVVGFIPSS
jgi:hypothetical protein